MLTRLSEEGSSNPRSSIHRARHEPSIGAELLAGTPSRFLWKVSRFRGHQPLIFRSTTGNSTCMCRVAPPPRLQQSSASFAGSSNVFHTCSRLQGRPQRSRPLTVSATANPLPAGASLATFRPAALHCQSQLAVVSADSECAQQSTERANSRET